VPAIGIAVITRDRREDLLGALARIPRGVPVCVVDNGSTDGTVAAVRAAFPDADVVSAGRNLGAGGRTLAAQRLGTPYAAFADDDSWWAPGALERAVALLDRHPRLGLIAARVLVGPDERLDPVCEAMRDSPLLADPSLPGPPVLGFVACGAIVRTEAFFSVGGFDERYGIGGEELRLAMDLAAAGWQLAYVDDVVAHHHPATGGRAGRSWRLLRNDLWSAWLRRPLPAAAAATVRLLRGASPPVAARAYAEATAGLPWVLRERRVVPPELEEDIALLERGG
jgi:GT2 family glycosyltransferase